MLEAAITNANQLINCKIPCQRKCEHASWTSWTLKSITFHCIKVFSINQWIDRVQFYLQYRRQCHQGCNQRFQRQHEQELCNLHCCMCLFLHYFLLETLSMCWNRQRMCARSCAHDPTQRNPPVKTSFEVRAAIYILYDHVSAHIQILI
jgi:hypothetical protein